MIANKTKHSRINVWVVLVILLSIVSAGLGFTLYYFYQDYEGVKNRMEELVNSYETQISKYKTENDACKETITQYEERITGLESENSEKDTEIASYKDKVSEAETVISRYENIYDSMTKFSDSHLGYHSSKLYADQSVYILEEGEEQCKATIHMDFGGTMWAYEDEDDLKVEWTKEWKNHDTELVIKATKKGVYVAKIYDENDHGFYFLVIKK